jgi:hypothetical protein
MVGHVMWEMLTPSRQLMIQYKIICHEELVHLLKLAR